MTRRLAVSVLVLAALLGGCGREPKRMRTGTDARTTAAVERVRLSLLPVVDALDAARADGAAKDGRIAALTAEVDRLRAGREARPAASRSGRHLSGGGAAFVPAANPGGLLRRIGGCESSGRPDGPLNWAATNRQGTSASGAYQVLDSTWHNWAKAYGADVSATRYGRAMQAPPDVQTTVAGRALAAQGTGPWAASRGCWG